MTTERPVEFAVAIPQVFSGPQVDPAALRAFLSRAEALGYHSVWGQEQILGAAGTLEPVTLLAHAAALTRRVRLGVAVLLTPLRSPLQLAKSLTTVDQLSGGRLTVGVGLGGRTDVYPAFGLSAERRVRRFTEGLEVLKRLWTQERVTFSGEFWKLENVAMAPKPIQKPHPPIWFGARHPNALRRAVALGEGFIGAGSTSTADFRRQVAHVRASLGEAKRNPSTFAIAKRVYLAVDPDRGRALARLREWFGWYYGNAALADQVAIVGPAEECVTGLREVRAAGAELILLNFVSEELENMERAAREILPAVVAR
ncbi:MAG: LLM class flavin-dependent oxidoreductase [Candidatus Rokubacteria bacterium]|nr:LLM class flavin-dependent oxidoreductase [Candidatus Rokubacteria bacterium]